MLYIIKNDLAVACYDCTIGMTSRGQGLDQVQVTKLIAASWTRLNDDCRIIAVSQGESLGQKPLISAYRMVCTTAV